MFPKLFKPKLASSHITVTHHTETYKNKPEKPGPKLEIRRTGKEEERGLRIDLFLQPHPA